MSGVVRAHGNAYAAWQMQCINNVAVLVVSFAFVQAITLIIQDIYFFTDVIPDKSNDTVPSRSGLPVPAGMVT